ncbi:NAD-dependent epimerase/dehydratase family protein [Bradyrhizobium sp. SZCCHNS2005]|uniref:NAD-dependent epimerase/dehydratase family protein n=1 Tax=Bradyrhizobium sp. SZCCHNS2005 TaxID=3057303 RepID=UPI0028E9F24D|nr:NAD-dependent epimerase/dehydratase family protein [Bradyrhizobium sp. SZCCHNS2005]
MIGILGATGYVGASLARVLATAQPEPLVLFARRPDILRAERWPEHVSVEAIADFSAKNFDLVINAVGAGAPGRVAALSSEILDITQAWDDRVLTTMSDRTRYVFLSSGAIYGGGFSAPVDEGTEIVLPVNRLDLIPPYTLAKLQAEIRHRHLPRRPILDLRIFGYADAAIPLDSHFFLADLARCVAHSEVFVTSPDPMVRDYAGALELAALIGCWRAAGAANMAVDLYTEKSVSKDELLTLATSRFGLEVEYVRTTGSPTGAKSVYASNYRKATTLGYKPARSSLDIVLSVLEAAADRGRRGGNA